MNSVYSKVKCDNDIVDECWQVSVEYLDDDGDIPTSDIPCWQVSVDIASCWEVTGNDRCKQREDVPPFDRDIDMDKHDIFKVFAVHISHENIYMAVQMRDPDDPDELTYLDDWGSATKPYNDGSGVTRYVYHPTYKATEIVRVFDIFGDLPYEEITNEFGYKSIVRPEKDINFSVIYRIDMGYRLIKGLFSTEWDIQGHYMMYIEKSTQFSTDLIGDGCLLMGKEVSTLTPTIVFTGKNKQSFKLIDVLDVLDLESLSTEGLNYMLTDTIAMKHESSSYFKVDEDVGYGRMFSNTSPLMPDNIGAEKIVGIMQNEHRTVGFTDRGSVDVEKWKYETSMMLDIVYSWYHNPPPSSWGGSGSTGSVVDGDAYSGQGFFTTSIYFVPTTPIDETGVTVCGIRTMGTYSFPICNYNTFYGMVSQFGYVAEGDYYFDRDELPLENRVRIATDDWLLNEEDFFVITKNGVIHIMRSGYLNGYPKYDLWKLGDDTVMDFCYWHGVVIMADGTNVLKVRSVV